MNDCNIFLFTSFLLQFLNVIPNFGNAMIVSELMMRKREYLFQDWCMKRIRMREYDCYGFILLMTNSVNDLIYWSIIYTIGKTVKLLLKLVSEYKSSAKKIYCNISINILSSYTETGETLINFNQRKWKYF